MNSDTVFTILILIAWIGLCFGIPMLVNAVVKLFNKKGDE